MDQDKGTQDRRYRKRCIAWRVIGSSIEAPFAINSFVGFLMGMRVVMSYLRELL